MILDLVRHTFTERSTIGSLAVDGVHYCYMLEPTLESESGGPICIPAGRYQVTVRHSSRFRRPVLALLDVPGRTDIEIHVGNAEKDTTGHLLPGLHRAANFVGSSMEAEEGLLRKISSALAAGEECWIEISATVADAA
jgi:hypothetical protein